MNLKQLLGLTVTLSAVSACSMFGGDSDSDKDKAAAPAQTAEVLYGDAMDEFREKHYKDSVKAFEEVERQHPSSDLAMNAQIMSGFASYEAEDYDTAVATLQRFVKLYPNNESTPYAYYLTALCYYEQISDIGRDQKMTQEAMQSLREVIRRFPDTEYARDARIKLDLTQDHLAGKEMEIGRYYLRHDDYIAAINRFRFVVENYQTTSHVPEALHRLVEAYLRLGVRDEAQRYASVLGHNFPASIWYRDSYKLMNGGAKPVHVTKHERLPEPESGSTAAPATPVDAPSEKTDDKQATEKPSETPVPVDEKSWWEHLIP